MAASEANRRQKRYEMESAKKSVFRLKCLASKIAETQHDQWREGFRSDA